MTTKPYIRKTHDEFEIQQFTSYGWECVNTETTRKAARISIKEYRENQPGTYQIKRKMVKNDPTPSAS
jgi:hypothetical protein